MPRSGSACHASSLLRRMRTMSLAPANLRLALTISAAEFQVKHARESDAGLRRYRRLDVPVALLAVHDFDARRSGRAVDGGAETAQVLEEKLSRRGIAP